MAFNNIITIFLFALLVLPGAIMAQGGSSESVPNIYLDCPGFCDQTYIRTNIPQVNYVRDQDDADIYLRLTNAGTGSGQETILDFRGIPPFSTRRDTVIYFTPNTNTYDESRAELVRNVKIGLVPFLVNTSAARNIEITFTNPGNESEEEETHDPWDSWVFDVGINSSLNGEESDKTLNLNGGLEAERITAKWKILADLSGSINRREVKLSSGTLTINRDFGRFNSLVAYSLSDHASIGLFTEFSSSQTGNIERSFEIAPAFEYSVFPYNEFQERRFFISYRVTPSYRNYHATTIFLKDEETVVRQVLSAQLRYDQPWGRIDIRASASNYFHDSSVNRFEVNPSFNIRIIRGLSFNLNGRFRSINDQISLPAQDITDEEALVGARQRATSYDYFVSFGLSYTFGSIYSNTVNPRF